MGMDFSAFASIPGIDTIRQTVESEIFWGPWEYNRAFIVPCFIDASGARDTGGSPTTLLRAGLLMGMIRTSKLSVEWDVTATDGSEEIYGPLLYSQQTQQLGSDKDRWFGFCAVGGNIKASKLIIPGAATAGIDGNAKEYEVVRQMAGRFNFDGLYNVYKTSSLYGGWRKVVAKTANYTVTVDDTGCIFSTAASTNVPVVFTLPAVANNRGLRYGFYCTEDGGISIASSGSNDDIICHNDVTADSLTISTTGKTIGSFVEILGVGGTKWYSIVHLGASTHAVTVG